MPEAREVEVRTECLRLAIQVKAMGHQAAVIDIAQEYYNFITKREGVNA